MNPMQAKPRPEGLDHPIVPKALRVISRLNVWLYQRTDGRLGGKWRVGSAFPHGIPVLLLTTIGHKSGQRRTAPLLYIEDGERLVLVGSQGGMPRHPLWYTNIQANPDVEVQLKSQHLAMRARDATPEERAVLWPRFVAHYNDLADYQAWTDRVIPLVVLEPRT
jgi:deazaflavin-dependent oxidoreductase (nitroreductase family)